MAATTYSTRSNATRAARNAGLVNYTIEKIDGRFAIAVTIAAPKADDIRRISEIERPCDTVAMICRANPEASRKELMAICERAGIAYNTARTQIQRNRSRAA